MQVLARKRNSLFEVLCFVVVQFGFSGSVMGQQGGSSVQVACINFGNPERTSARHKYVIEKPGHYCLTEDLHARIEFADHPAEDTMIAIWSGDVVLDLQGHTLGRGRIFKNPGGHGIEIVDPDSFKKGTGIAKSIAIRNGALEDFGTAIFFADRWPSTFLDTPTFDPTTNTYHFPANNITLENITFKNNKKDFEIHVPDEPKK